VRGSTLVLEVLWSKRYSIMPTPWPPPETVESLRAERDEALAEMEEVEAAWRQEQIMHQRAWATIRNLQAELAAALRDNERFEGEQEELVQALDKLSAANDTIVRLRATHTQAEAAWGRCARED